MPEEENRVEKALSGVAGKWTAYAAIGSFLLYLFGYLTLRFELSAYGVATDLDVLDEKYLFAGSRFLVFLTSAASSVLLILAFLALLLYGAYSLSSASIKERICNWGMRCRGHQIALSMIGIVFSLLFIQLILRKCFVLGNLLLADGMPRNEWIASILLTRDSLRSLYFTGLVGGALLIGSLLFLAVYLSVRRTLAADVLLAIQVFVFVVAFLLLPINYGVLIGTQELPRVLEVGGEKLSPNEQAWLVWENKDVLTYLLRDAGNNRSLLTIPRKENSVRIVAYDGIFQVLFAGAKSSAPVASQGGMQ